MSIIRERQLEDLIFQNLDKLSERGFIEMLETTKRQFTLPSGRIIDIFTFDVYDDILYFKIIELKKGEICGDSLFQIARYAQEVTILVKDYFYDYKMELIIIGEDMSTDIFDMCFVDLGVRIFLYDIRFDGLMFEEQIKGTREVKVAKSNKTPQKEEFCNKLKNPWIEEVEKMALEEGVSPSEMAEIIINTNIQLNNGTLYRI